MMVTMRRKVMILDDDEEFLEELKETLSLSGFDVIAISDVDVFLSEIYKIRPAVILLDIKMPKKSGFEVAYELKEYTQKNPTPIIVMSAFVEEDFIFLPEAHGIKKFLKKPFNPLNIITAIEDALA